jgi:hypothetical protein
MTIHIKNVDSVIVFSPRGLETAVLRINGCIRPGAAFPDAVQPCGVAAECVNVAAARPGIAIAIAWVVGTADLG